MKVRKIKRVQVKKPAPKRRKVAPNKKQDKLPPLPDKSPGEKLDVRTADGRWAKGHKGGPGNPQYNMIPLYRRAINEAVTPKDLKKVMWRLLQIALYGQESAVAAAKVLLDRTVGAVKQEVTISEAARRLVVEEVIDATEADRQVKDFPHNQAGHVYADDEQ